VVSFAKLRYRPFQHDTGGGRVLRYGVSYLHSTILALNQQPNNGRAHCRVAYWPTSEVATPLIEVRLVRPSG
jgi:hypothetical protein